METFIAILTALCVASIIAGCVLGSIILKKQQKTDKEMSEMYRYNNRKAVK